MKNIHSVHSLRQKSVLHRQYGYVQEYWIYINDSPQIAKWTGGLYIYTFMWDYYILCIVNNDMLATATDLHTETTNQHVKETIWSKYFGVSVRSIRRPMESYMFLDLKPGRSLGEEGAVHGGECTAGKAKISLFFVIGQRSISKSFRYGLSGTMKPSAVTVTVWVSIRGHENLPRGSWETLLLSAGHESWKKIQHFVSANYQARKDRAQMGVCSWHHLYSAPDPASGRLLWSDGAWGRPKL